MKKYIFTLLSLLTVCSCDSPKKTFDLDEVISIRPHPPIQELFNYTMIGQKAWSSKDYDYDILLEGKCPDGAIPMLDVFKGKVGTHYALISLEVTNVIEGDYNEREFVFGHTYTSHKDGNVKQPNFVGEFRLWVRKMSVGYLITHIEEISNKSTHSITASGGSE